MISLASTCLNWLAKSSRTAPSSSPVPNRFKKPFNCSTRSLSVTVSSSLVSVFWLALGSSTCVAAVSTGVSLADAASSPCRFGISPSKVKPAFMNALTISIMDTPFILAPFGMVMILPTEFNITLLVISLNPKPFIISITSGYSVTKSYTDLDKSNFFSILIPSCQKYCLLLM